MPVTPFVTDVQRTGIVIAYKNPQYIADLVMPRVPVAGQLFDWDSHENLDVLTPVNTRVGRLSRPNSVTFSATRTQGQTFDDALDEMIPYADIENARSEPSNVDPQDRAAEQLAELIALGRERRVSTLLQTPGTFPSAQRLALSGSNVYSNAASTPIADISTLLDTALMRPNMAIFGRQAWSDFRRHPEIVSAILGNNGTKGVADRQGVADLFELDRIEVGTAWVNTAARGQAGSVSRVWGNAITFLYQDGLAGLTGSRFTFGMTAQWGDRIAASFEDPDIGMRGGIRLRVGESVREVVQASAAGCIITFS
jgi:hypothetical protein